MTVSLRVSWLLALAMTLPARVALAQAPKTGDAGLSDKPNAVRGDEITPRQQAAVERGLAYLAGRQARNGSFGMGAAYGRAEGGHPGITALAGLAFMSAGNLPGRGKYGDNVAKALRFILSCSQQSGFISQATSGEMYSHGFATLFLAEIYGMTGDDEVREKLVRAVQLIQKTQNKEGGWRYQPVPADADISITICQVMALRAARDAGIKVSKDVIDDAIKYVKTCRCPDGGFSYTAGGGGSAFPRSAAGVATLYYAGIFEGDDITRGLKYLRQFIPGKVKGGAAAAAGVGGHYFYGHYYAVQAMFLAGGEYWQEWYPAIREELIQKQVANTGGWSGEAGEDYATAMALIILQMPNRYLPVFHGKGPGS